jgi:hypothetical protein
VLLLQLGDIVIQATQHLLGIALILTQTIELLVGFQACLTMQRGQTLAQRVGQISMDGQQTSQPTANQQKHSSRHIVF